MADRELVREYFDYDLLTGMFTWRKTLNNKAVRGRQAGYIRRDGRKVIKFMGHLYTAGRLAFIYVLGYLPEEVDHINQRSNDDRWINLRPVTRAENQRNVPLIKTNTSGMTGVCWDKSREKWVAQIDHNGRHINLGRFSSKDDAIEVRKKANLQLGFHENHGSHLLRTK